MKKLLIVVLVLSVAILSIELISILPGNETEDNEETAAGMLIKSLMISGIHNSEIKLRDTYINPGRSDVPRRLLSLVEGKCLVYRFSGAECNLCIDHVIASLREVFHDYESNDRIMLVGSNLNRRVLQGYYGKDVLYLKGDRLGLPAEEYNMPCLFILDEKGKSELAFIPEKSFPEMTLAYLKDIRNRYFE